MYEETKIAMSAKCGTGRLSRTRHVCVCFLADSSPNCPVLLLCVDKEMVTDSFPRAAALLSCSVGAEGALDDAYVLWCFHNRLKHLSRGGVAEGVTATLWGLDSTLTLTH